MAVRWSAPEVTREDKAEGIPITDIEQLLMAARMSGAPDDALFKVDVRMEIASPANINRAVVVWKPHG